MFSGRKPFKTSGLGMHWDTEDPFIFVSHHEDDYPHGNRQQAPPLNEISGRNLGRDYDKRLGFRMYHGKVVPGFPMHAHWGYETITLAETGYVDHYDTEGVQGRFGFGDVQWVSASSKYEHCEMYPLANQEDRNPNDITQIMVNLPLEMKNQPNSVSTVWAEDVPVVRGDGWDSKVLCGRFGGTETESPNPVSYARVSNGVRIVRLRMDPGASITVDPAADGARRNLYFVSGKDAEVCGTEVQYYTRMKFSDLGEFTVTNGEAESVMWLLEGRPIDQRMASFGPVVLGDLKDVRTALDEIRRNEFLEWPWDIIDKAQPLGTERFIKYADGTERRPGARRLRSRMVRSKRMSIDGPRADRSGTAGWSGWAGGGTPATSGRRRAGGTLPPDDDVFPRVQALRQASAGLSAAGASSGEPFERLLP